MRHHDPPPLTESQRDPLNEAIGTLPRPNTAERKVYRKLWHKWRHFLSDEQQRFVCGFIAADGDYIGAVLAQGLVAPTAPMNDIERTVRRLSADRNVRDCLRMAAHFIKPTTEDFIVSLRPLLSHMDPMVRLRATEQLMDLYPDEKPGGKVASVTKEMRRGLTDIVRVARQVGVLSATGEVEADGGNLGATEKVPEHRKYDTWRVPDPDAEGTNGTVTDGETVPD